MSIVMADDEFHTVACGGAPTLLSPSKFALQMRGAGQLSGAYPGGITRVEGVPGSARIVVKIRSDDPVKDGALVADIESQPDGTWLVSGLDPELRYDVICRLSGYNDMILSDVAPVTV